MHDPRGGPQVLIACYSKTSVRNNPNEKSIALSNSGTSIAYDNRGGRHSSHRTAVVQAPPTTPSPLFLPLPSVRLLSCRWGTWTRGELYQYSFKYTTYPRGTFHLWYAYIPDNMMTSFVLVFIPKCTLYFQCGEIGYMYGKVQQPKPSHQTQRFRKR